MYRNVKNRTLGRKELVSHPIPRAAEPEPTSFPLAARHRAKTGSQSRHRLSLNCTFTFTQTISKSWNKCRGRGGEGQVPLRSQDPRWASPGKGEEGASGCQSLGTSSPRARAQQASSPSHINTDTLNKNSISSSRGIKTSLEYVQQRARPG